MWPQSGSLRQIAPLIGKRKHFNTTPSSKPKINWLIARISDPFGVVVSMLGPSWSIMENMQQPCGFALMFTAVCRYFENFIGFRTTNICVLRIYAISLDTCNYKHCLIIEIFKHMAYTVIQSIRWELQPVNKLRDEMYYWQNSCQIV